MRKLIVAVLATLCGGASALAGPSGAALAAVPAAGCSPAVQLTALTFDPPQAAPGQSSRATVVAQNCTDQPQTFSVLTTARFVGATSGIPAGCPAIDPLPPQQVTLPAGGTWTGSTSYLIFAGCTATALEVTARASDQSGAVLDSRTADLPITAAAPPCAVAYRVTSQRSRGFAAQVTITDTAAAPITGWTAGFAFTAGQRVTSAWDATVTQAGATVSATAKSYDATIAPGASVSFGFLGTWSGTNPAPTAFTVNGTTCQIR